MNIALRSIHARLTRRFDRASWLALGGVLLIAVISGAGSIVVLWQVSDGCLLDNNTDIVLVITCVGEWPTPLRSGDEIIAVGGVVQAQKVSLQQPQMSAGWVDGGTVRYTIKRDGTPLDLDVPLHRLGWNGTLRAFGSSLVQQLPRWHTFALLGAIMIFALRPRIRTAQLVLVALGGLYAILALTWASNSIAASAAPTPVWFVLLFLNLCWGWLFAPTLLLVVLSFPRRVWPLARRPRLTVVLIYGLPLAAIAASFITGNIVFYLAALGLGTLSVIVATLAVTTHTFLRVPDAVVRAQTSWLALGIGVGLAFFPAMFVLGFAFPDLRDAIERLPPWIGLPFQAIPSLVFPLCLGIAITRYRLFDIDLIINRTLVYASLTGAVIGIYLLVVGYLGWLLQTGDNLVLSLIATGIVAVVFAPIRNLVQRGVNRLLYGERDEPYQVLTRLGQRLETALGPISALTLTVETIAQALKLPYVAITLRQADEVQTVVAYGAARNDVNRYPLTYTGEVVGELVAASRAPNETLNPADQRLLHDLARQIGTVAHGVSLTARLEQARLRLVTERGEARRRLGSDLHDRIGHQLAAATRQVERANHLVGADQNSAQVLLNDITQQLRSVAQEVRGLAHELFPPELALLALSRQSVSGHWRTPICPCRWWCLRRYLTYRLRWRRRCMPSRWRR